MTGVQRHDSSYGESWGTGVQQHDSVGSPGGQECSGMTLWGVLGDRSAAA